MKLLIKNGHVIDPSGSMNRRANILIENGIIKGYPTETIKIEKEKKTKVIDVAGQIVSPGFIDMHVHLREPGYEHKETIQTGCEAASAGGFTSVVCMPNTNPINDNASVTEYILLKARTEGIINVFTIGAITKEEKGEDLAQIGEMFEAGCVGISDDGMPVMNSRLMRRAMEYVKAFGIPVISHAEDKNLSLNGVMNEGFISNKLGLQGIPNASEEVMVARDITLSDMTGAHLHIAHVSTKSSVRLIRDAKKRGINITAEATPHHFNLTDDAIGNYDTNAKVNPPIRTQEDMLAIRDALSEGTIDVIATDHAPHTEDEKKVEFDLAPFGISGLETALSLSLKLVEDEVLSLYEMVKKLTIEPAKIIKIDRGTLSVGSVADIVIFDPSVKFVVDRMKFRSKGKNSPFHGWELYGVVSYTIVNGNIVYSMQ